MNKPEVKFSAWMERGFELFKDNAGVLILATLVVVLLSSVTMGILSGPMMAGLILVVLGLIDKREPKPQVGEVFQGFNFFLQSFLFYLVWGLLLFVIAMILAMIPCIGQLAVIFLSFAASALLMFGLFLIVDKKMDFWPASMDSINTVKANFWPFLGFSIVASIIGSLGSLLCGIGIIVTMPIFVCMIAVAYCDVFRGGDQVEVKAADDASAPPREVTEPPAEAPAEPEGAKDAPAEEEPPKEGEEDKPAAGE